MNLELKKKKKGPKKKDEEELGAVMRGVRDKLNPTENPYEKSNINPHEKPNGNQSNLPPLLPPDLPCYRHRICLAAATAFALLPSLDPTQMDLD